MAGSDEYHGRSRRPSVEDRGWPGIGRILGSQTIRRSDNAVCGLQHAREDEEREFFGWVSKPRSMVFQWFGLKTAGTISPGLTSKPVITGFLVWALKPTAIVW
jgi:hypothetical protein